MPYGRLQWTLFLSFTVVNLFAGACISLQAPFYPAEAESKGASASEYGLVFGAFQLTAFLVTPGMGKYFNLLGAKFLLNAGIFLMGSTCFLFGFLNFVHGHKSFIGLSFAIRIVEAIGYAAFLTASFSIIAKEFPDNIPTVFSALETCFGTGTILGPSIGSVLYEAGGFTLPFVTLGSCMVLVSGVVFVVCPSWPNASSKSGSSLTAVLSRPRLAISAFTVVFSAFSLEFNDASLEPHLRPLNLSTYYIGLMFSVLGVTYALSAPIMGWLCERHLHPRCVMLSGALCVAIGYINLGPAPYLPSVLTVPKASICLAVLGIGAAALYVSTMISLLQDAVEYGFPDDFATYGVIASIWNSSLSLGSFLGPSSAGILLDTVGYPIGSQVIVVLMIIVFICNLTEILSWKYRKTSKSAVNGEIVPLLLNSL